MALVATRSALERGLAFVTEHGDALARVRGDALAGRGNPRRVESLLAVDTQALDLQEALHVLRVCADLRVLGVSTVREICSGVSSCQAADGAWRVAGLDEEEVLHLSGALAGQLAKTRYARPDLLAAAGEYLAQRWSPDRVQDGRWRDLAAYAQFFANVDHERSDEILQWCGRELERGFRSQRFDALRTMRILLDCDAHSLPGARFEPGELFVALVSQQASDGSFGAAPEASARLEDTLDALCALRHFSGGP